MMILFDNHNFYSSNGFNYGRSIYLWKTRHSTMETMMHRDKLGRKSSSNLSSAKNQVNVKKQGSQFKQGNNKQPVIKHDIIQQVIAVPADCITRSRANQQVAC